jgi:hypothetical protein
VSPICECWLSMWNLEYSYIPVVLNIRISRNGTIVHFANAVCYMLTVSHTCISRDGKPVHSENAVCFFHHKLSSEVVGRK